MRFYLSLVMGGCDLLVGLSYARERQWALAITWFCYAVAAVALASINQR